MLTEKTLHAHDDSVKHRRSITPFEKFSGILPADKIPKRTAVGLCFQKTPHREIRLNPHACRDIALLGAAGDGSGSRASAGVLSHDAPLISRKFVIG